MPKDDRTPADRGPLPVARRARRSPDITIAAISAMASIIAVAVGVFFFPPQTADVQIIPLDGPTTTGPEVIGPTPTNGAQEVTEDTAENSTNAPAVELDPALADALATIIISIGALIIAALVVWQVTNAVARYRADRRYEEVRRRVQAAEKELQAALESQDQTLALQRIWAVVHERLEQYHQDAQSQGRIAFSRAMFAMSLGFFVLIACVGAMTFFATSTAGIVVTGSVAAVSAGVAGYVSRTYLRAYQDSAHNEPRFTASDSLKTPSTCTHSCC